ncbi:neurocan core protein-like [Ptychodera flava]|uniref:neurocan core protein-like n=1 Tax=Ptychodera flava TaxID=63121 RepID=UPI00396A215C
MRKVSSACLLLLVFAIGIASSDGNIDRQARHKRDIEQHTDKEGNMWECEGSFWVGNVPYCAGTCAQCKSFGSDIVCLATDPCGQAPPGSSMCCTTGNKELCGFNCNPVVIDHCLPNPCMNGGTCSQDSQGYTCSCTEDYVGDDCEIVDRCKLNPCMNGGACFNEPDNFKCSCLEGFTGPTCEIRAIRICTLFSASHEGKSWSDARSDCEQQGGTLAHVSNARRQRLLGDHLDKSQMYWLGANDQDADGDWQYTDDTSVCFNGWQNGVPPTDNDRQCAKLQWVGGSPAWFNEDCSSTEKFICQQTSVLGLTPGSL